MDHRSIDASVRWTSARRMMPACPSMRALAAVPAGCRPMRQYRAAWFRLPRARHGTIHESLRKPLSLMERQSWYTSRSTDRLGLLLGIADWFITRAPSPDFSRNLMGGNSSATTGMMSANGISNRRRQPRLEAKGKPKRISRGIGNASCTQRHAGACPGNKPWFFWSGITNCQTLEVRNILDRSRFCWQHFRDRSTGENSSPFHALSATLRSQFE